MSREKLEKIRSLTFYKDEKTKARRTSAIPQLVCRGAPCKLFQPEVVRCTNTGGSGTDVDWTCQADLPEALRFGRVEVSCEGWDKPGDPYVLKGSCGLEYRLVEVPGVLRKDSSYAKEYSATWDIPKLIFSILWFAFLIFISYNFFMSCFRRNATNRGPQAPNTGPRPGFSGHNNSGSGWFPGSMGDDQAPPPYSKYQQGSGPQAQGWTPGFWTGAALGGLANHLWNRNPREEHRERTQWDWERPRRSMFGASPPTSRRRFDNDDRGEGPSNLGSMRRSTGLGGSNVR